MPVPFDLDPSFAFLIADIGRLKRLEFNRAISKLVAPLSAIEARALVYVGRANEIPQAMLARMLGLEPMPMSLLIKRLEKADLISRQKDPEDRRGKRISLTPSGNQILSRVVEVMQSIECKTAALADPETWQEMLSFLQNLRAHLIVEQKAYAAPG